MSVGESLARAREERGMSVEDVSQSTRVRTTVIQAIERDDFAPCGGAVYARGHIRSIGHTVGIDPEPLVAEFDREHGTAPAALVVAGEAHVFDPAVMAASERRRPNWGAAMAVALVVICVLALVQLVHGAGSSGPARHDVAQTVTPTSTARTKAPSSAPPSALARLPGGVTVLLRVTGAASWCSVKDAAGTVLFEGTLSQGQQKLFKDDKQVSLVLGNAGAVDLVVNGHDLGAPGAQGAVVRAAYGPGDPTGAAAG